MQLGRRRMKIAEGKCEGVERRRAPPIGIRKTRSDLQLQLQLPAAAKELRKTKSDSSTSRSECDTRKIENKTLVVIDKHEAIAETPAPPDFKQPSETHICKLQNNNIVDLVMWKKVSKSAFVFGFGSFIFLSSSFTRDVNLSFISGVSYMALLYLAATFFYKSILWGNIQQQSNHMYLNLVKEEEALWLLHFILPYFNAFLFNFKILFSGDPATTLKLAVLLFVLAQCGNSITIWNTAKFGFLGVFTVPKICSRYSTQLTAYGNFWTRRFGDVWHPCSHKKVVVAAIFTLVWNLSSTTARVWAAFVLVVTVRYYQQSLCYLREEWLEDEQIKGREEEEDVYPRKPDYNVPNLTQSLKDEKRS